MSFVHEEHLIGTLLEDKTIRQLPLPEDPAFALSDATRRDGFQRAHKAIGPMFWGDRLPLDQSADLIRDGLEKIERPDA